MGFGRRLHHNSSGDIKGHKLLRYCTSSVETPLRMGRIMFQNASTKEFNHAEINRKLFTSLVIEIVPDKLR